MWRAVEGVARMTSTLYMRCSEAPDRLAALLPQGSVGGSSAGSSSAGRAGSSSSVLPAPTAAFLARLGSAAATANTVWIAAIDVAARPVPRSSGGASGSVATIRGAPPPATALHAAARALPLCTWLHTWRLLPDPEPGAARGAGGGSGSRSGDSRAGEASRAYTVGLMQQKAEDQFTLMTLSLLVHTASRWVPGSTPGSHHTGSVLMHVPGWTGARTRMAA
jgi:hypothetical protein